jgi:hypothetical protein
MAAEELSDEAKHSAIDALPWSAVRGAETGSWSSGGAWIVSSGTGSAARVTMIVKGVLDEPRKLLTIRMISNWLPPSSSAPVSSTVCCCCWSALLRVLRRDEIA